MLFLRTALLMSVSSILIFIGACAAPSRLPSVHVNTFPVNEMLPVSTRDTIKVLSLNTAHGRSMGLHQALQNSEEARSNLDDIAAMLYRENADVIALQEVDGPSVWSGKFDHVDYLAQAGGYSASIRGTHMKSPGLDYGTALLSRYPLDDAMSFGFGHALSITRKGFVVSKMQWPGRISTSVDLVSLHLHPFRAAARMQQVEQLIDVLRERNRPVVIMGDFNDNWHNEDSAVRFLSDELGLSTHGYDCTDCFTHRRLKFFVDWILVSKEIGLEGFAILDDEISDHYGVSATLRLRTPAGQGTTAAP